MCQERLYPLHKQRLCSLTYVTRKKLRSDGNKATGSYASGGQREEKGGRGEGSFGDRSPQDTGLRLMFMRWNSF